MAARVLCWLTDDEKEAYLELCDRLGVEFTQLGTLILCQALNLEDIPKKHKKRDKWLADHESRTRVEFRKQGSGTVQRVEELMRSRPEKKWWSTPEVVEGLGWKRTGSLMEYLSDPRFEEIRRPKDYKKGRGRQPRFWRLKEEK